VPGLTLDEPIQRYQYISKTGTIDIPVGMILDLPFFNPLDPVLTLSPLQAGATSVDSGNLGRTWNKNLKRNGAKPSGALTTDNTLTDIQITRLRDQIDSQYAGEANSGKQMILEGGLKWDQFSMSPLDMDWSNSQKMSTVDICRIYNVAPELIGDSANKTYSNYKEARVALYEETVLPFLDYFCEEVNNWITPLYGQGVWLDYNRDAIEALQEGRDAIYTRIKDAYWLTPNEKRIECDVDPLTDPMMDKLYIPSNLVPIELAGLQSVVSAIPPSKSSSCTHEVKDLLPLTDEQNTMAAKVQTALDKIRADALKMLEG
jgi:HK97 family phage portal protein